MMRRFFEVFRFEDVPATDRRPDELYLDEVERCDLYVGLFGKEYGAEDAPEKPHSASGGPELQLRFSCSNPLRSRGVFLV